MAWDKVTKIDTIAKRKAYSKENQGVLVEHVDAAKRAGDNSWANFKRPMFGRKVRSHHNHNVSGLGSAWQTPATGFVR